MNKILITLSPILFFFLIPSSAFAQSISPTSITSLDTIMQYDTATTSEVVAWVVYDTNNILLNSVSYLRSGETWFASMNEDPRAEIGGTYKALLVDETIDACDGYEECKASVMYLGVETTLTLSIPNPFISQLANATSTFQATTGFDIDGVISWGGDNLIKLFIGSGLAVLLYLRGWLVALVIIGAIIYFAYRAFRFFRH